MNYSYITIINMRNECIKTGNWFSEEELEEIRRKEQDKVKAKWEEIEKITNERRKEKRKKREKILRDLKNYIASGKSRVEIAEIMNCSSTTIGNLRKKCIEDNNWFSDEEISLFKKQRKIREINGTEEEFEKLSLEDKIRVAKQEKLKQDAEIKARQEEEKKVKARQRAEKKAKKEAERKVKQEEEKRVKEQQRAEKKAKQEEERKAKQEEEKRVKEQQRAEKKAKKEAERKAKQEEEKRVKAQQRAEKKAKQEEEKKLKARQRAERKVQKEEAIKELKKHYKNGKTYKEIAEIMNCSNATISNLRKECIESGTWFNEEELKEIKQVNKGIRYPKNQIKPEAKEKKKKIESEKEIQRKKKEQERKKEHDKTIKEFKNNIIDGKTYKEIAEAMYCSISTITNLRKECEKKGEWFSKEQIKEFVQQRKIREAKEREIRKKEEEKQRKIAERKVKQDELIREKSEKKEIKNLKSIYSSLKVSARQEDREDLRGEENVSIEGRKKFIEILMKLHKANVVISKKDIDIVTNLFYSHPELANKENIKFLISNEAIKNGYESAEKIVQELKYSLDETPYYNLLVQYGEWLKKQSFISQMIEMKSQNLTNTEISKKLGISSAEVAILLDSKKGEIPDFKVR